MSFIEALVRLRICLFRHVFCRRESNKTCHFSTVFTLLLLTIVSVSHIYCRQRARFHCIFLSHRGCLIWVKFVKIPKQTFESQLTVINPCSTHVLFSDKARCFSQSERALYGNFIINGYKQGAVAPERTWGPLIFISKFKFL